MVSSTGRVIGYGVLRISYHTMHSGPVALLVKPPGVLFQFLTSLPPYTDEDNTVVTYTLGSLSMVTRCTFWSYTQSLGDCEVLWLKWALV